MTFIDAVYQEVSAAFYPTISPLLTMHPLEIYQYLNIGEYSAPGTVDWEQNIAFLWLILIIEGYEK